jgi:virulence-associated protein VapD
MLQPPSHQQLRLPELGLPQPPNGNQRMYAIAFGLVVEDLRRHYNATNPNAAYFEVRAILEEEGFAWQQGSVYFGDPERVNMVKCMLATRRLGRDLPWFSKCVRDIRMLRVEEGNDLMPVLLDL